MRVLNIVKHDENTQNFIFEDLRILENVFSAEGWICDTNYGDTKQPIASQDYEIVMLFDLLKKQHYLFTAEQNLNEVSDTQSDIFNNLIQFQNFDDYNARDSEINKLIGVDEISV